MSLALGYRCVSLYLCFEVDEIFNFFLFLVSVTKASVALFFASLLLLTSIDIIVCNIKKNWWLCMPKTLYKCWFLTRTNPIHLIARKHFNFRPLNCLFICLFRPIILSGSSIFLAVYAEFFSIRLIHVYLPLKLQVATFQLR